MAVELNIPRLVARGGRLQGLIPLAHFKRLGDYLLDPISGDLDVSLAFGGTDIHRNGIAFYRLRGALRVECNRCSGEMLYTLDDTVEFAFVNSEAEANELDERYEPIVLADDGKLHTVDLLEDELILQLPIAPRHQQGEQCIEKHLLVEVEQGDELTEHEQQRENPFAALKSLNLN